MRIREKAFIYKLLKIVIGPFFKLYYNPKIINKHLIPDSGPIIIVGNHKHTFDQFGPILSTKRLIHYMAKKEYFDGKASLFGRDNKINCSISKWVVKSSGCISVDRSKKDTEAVESAMSILNNDGSVGLFPEGTRNKTEMFLLPFKFGAVSMAEKSDALLVPFGITGDYKFRSKNLVIRFGEPFKVGNMSLEEANNKLQREVEALMRKNLEFDK